MYEKPFPMRLYYEIKDMLPSGTMKETAKSLFFYWKKTVFLSFIAVLKQFLSASKSCKGFFKINFPPMRVLHIISGHVIYNPAYTLKIQLKTT